MTILPSTDLLPGRTVGVLATVLGTGAGVFLLFGPAVRYETVSTDGTRETGSVSGIDYLVGVEHSIPALFYWSLFVLGLSLIGGYGIWTGNRDVVLGVGLLLFGLSILGMMTIGLLVAPAAVLFLVSGVLLHRWSNGEGDG